MNKTQALSHRSTFLTKQAQEAWNYFNKSGYPSAKDENWRFSNPSPWLLKSLVPLTDKEDIKREEFGSYIISGTIPIIILNDSVSILNTLPEGVQIMDMEQADSEFLMDLPLGSIADIHTSSFSAENTALFQNGIIITISENTVLEKPIQLIYSIKRNKDSRIYPRIYVYVGSSSQIEILQTEVGDDDCQHLVNSVTEVFIQENSQLKWTLMQKWNVQTSQVSSFNIALEKNASASYNTFEFGGGFIRREIHSHLQSRGGDFAINSLFVPTAKQHIDIFSIVHHKGSHCSSRQLIKGVLGGSSSGVFRGLAHVYDKSKKTDAQQTNHNLLLSNKARMNSIPQLEIYEDDVKCSHGSTTGQIDEDAVFYLRSRGISRMDALELMVKGFANEVVDKVDHEQFKVSIQKALLRKMEGMM
jgi:Fe-S cluster assembly protein SufD